MKRLLLVLAVALIMAAMVATTATPALAQRLFPCVGVGGDTSETDPQGAFVCGGAQLIR